LSSQELFDEVQKESNSFGTLRDEVNLMLEVMELRRVYTEERAVTQGQKWKLPPSGQPISLFGAPSANLTVTGTLAGDENESGGPLERRCVMRPMDDSNKQHSAGKLLVFF